MNEGHQDTIEECFEQVKEYGLTWNLMLTYSLEDQQWFNNKVKELNEDLGIKGCNAITVAESGKITYL